MGQIKFTISLILIALFSIAVIGFATNFGVDNNARVQIANDSIHSSIKDSSEGDINIFYGDMNTSMEAMYKSTISSQTEATEGGTSFKVGVGNALSMAKETTTTAFHHIFGEDSGFGVFLTAFISVLGFISIMYIYKTWAGRNPD